MVYRIESIEKLPDFRKECGGKASNLFLLKKAGFNVPSFIVVPVSVVEKILAGKYIQINSLLTNFNDETLVETSEKILNIISGLKVDHEILEDVLGNLKSEIPNSTLFSVRSSVTLEDGATTSFAGLFNTRLNVDFIHLEEAIIYGIKSLFSPEVLKYSIHFGIDVSKNKLALVIQEMVDAKISGIGFSMNPQGNFNDMLISAAFGLGEGVVNNTSEISNYYVNRQNNQIAKDEIQPVLNFEQIELLSKKILEIEKFFGAPQDIEFSFDSHEKLYILQSRPITTINLFDLKILDNTNIVESYPGITLPLSFSFARNGYQKVFTSAARLFKVKEHKIKDIELELNNMITHFNGRIYYNLHNWYKLMQIILSSQNSLQAWETLIGVKLKTQKVSSSSVFKKLRSAFISILLLIRYGKIIKKFYDNFDFEYAKLRLFANNLKSEKPTSKQVYLFYKNISNRLFVNWAPTLLNDFFTFKFFDLLKKLNKSYGFSEDETINNDLLCGLPGVESEMLVIELLRLKEKIKNDKEALATFKLPANEVFLKLPMVFQEMIDEYIEKFGDRTLEELKLETPNFRMNKTGFIELLISQLNNSSTPESVFNQQNSIRQTAENRISQLQRKFSIKRMFYGYVLKKARETITNRENMRLCRTRSYGAVKELFYHIGSEMAENQLIEKPEDVFYLDVLHLENFAIKDDLTDLRSYILSKKSEFSFFENMNMPDRIVFNGEKPPIFSRIPVELRNDKIFYGTTISKGKLHGQTIVLSKPDYTQPVDGKILVTRMTDPAWVFLMTRAAGIISEKGSPLSHTAIVGRELGIPVIIGIENATRIFTDGTEILMNCDEGYVQIIECQKDI